MAYTAPPGTPTAHLTTNDGAVIDVAVPAGQNVVDAAARQSVVLPSLCGQGACGTCVATVTAGEYTHGSFSPDAIGPSSGEGAVLLCRTFPTSDLQVQLPYDGTRVVSSAPALRTATVTALEWLTADVVRLRLTYETDETFGAAAEFDPGQFVQVQVPGTDTWRAYSLAGTGNFDGELELLVHVLADGVFSTWLRARAAVGDTVSVRGPQGAFGLRENGLRPRWFVAGGTGLAPVLAMLRRMAEWGEPQPARLYHGVNTEADVFAQDEIAELTAALPDFVATTCIWHPQHGAGQAHDGSAVGEPSDAVEDAAGTRLVTGTPAEAVVRDLPRAEEPPDLYVCGPPAMVRATEYALAEAGVDAELVLTERFTDN